MSDPDQTEPIKSPADEPELKVDDGELRAIDISDDTLDAADQKADSAQKESKKTAKELQTPEERRRAKRKKLLITSGSVLAVLLLLLIIPLTRWPILNLVGVRATVAVTVQENESHKPLSSALVKIDDGRSVVTNSAGLALFGNSRLGKRTLVVQKTGYGDATSQVTNKLGTTKTTAKLKVIGIKLEVDVKDWLSQQALAGATVVSDKSTAQSDKTGRASLVIAPTDEKSVELTVSAAGYLTKTTTTELSAQSREVALVAAQKDYFISKRDGKFDIFSSNLDGSDQRKIIEATGKEDEEVVQFTIHRGNKQAILVANRDGKTKNGRLIAGIYRVDLEKSSITKVDEGSDVQLLGWGDNMVSYTRSNPDVTYDDPNFSRLMTLNIATNKLTQVAQTNYFQVAIAAQNKVFYQVADAYRTLEGAVLTSYDLGNNARKSYLTDRSVSYGSHATYPTLEFQTRDGANFELQIANGSVRAINHRPAPDLDFTLSPTSQAVLWSDQRDGQGALLHKNLSANDERVVARVGGLTAPVRFVSESLAVVRVSTSQETADYVVHLGSGKLAKIVDVSNLRSAQ